MIVTASHFSPVANGPAPFPQTNSLKPLPSDPNQPAIAILGIPFDNITTAQTVQAIEAMISSGKPHYLATANVDFLVQARHDVELRRILLDAHLVLCDGTPLVWASRLLGNPLPERVAGSDLVPLLIRLAAKKNYRIFFLGGSPDTTATAVANLRRQHPELNIAGHYSPPFAALLEMDHDQIAAQIKAAKPDLLFVSFGCPKQEKWISMHYRSLGVPVCVGVGATIDFLAGKIKRAPKWMQKTGTEWIFRAAQEPRRLMGRYLNGLWCFSFEIARQWWQFQRIGKRQIVRSTPSPQEKREWKRIKMPEQLNLETVRRDSLLCQEALATSRKCAIDLSEVKFVDSTGIGLLVCLQKKARVTGQQLVLLSPSKAVLSALRMMRLQDFFTIIDNLDTIHKPLEELGEGTPVVLQPNYYPSKPALFWRGEITAANADRVWQITSRHITSRAKNKEILQIDISSLQFIDSTGVRLMVRAKNEASAQGTRLQFVGIQPNVRNVLRLSRLESLVAESGK